MIAWYETITNRTEGTLNGSKILALPETGVRCFCAVRRGGRCSKRAETFTTLHSFCEGECTDGRFPQAALVQGTDGDLYGTMTQAGLIGSSGGTVYKITTDGALTTVYTFCSQSGCTDGATLRAALVQSANGDFFGTTFGGSGTVFKITPSGALTTLYSFYQTQSTDGSSPSGALVQAANGDFYGTTTQSGRYNQGTIFKITADGTLTALHSFCSQPNCTDGYRAYGSLIQAVNGEFYGTTFLGGANTSCQPGATTYGCGTVFRISASGTFTTLYSFCSQGGCTDGVNPAGVLVQAADGDLYGTTARGGASNCAGSGCGTIFKISPGGVFTTLYSFCSRAGCADGSAPYDGLIQATDGNLYGTTSQGGAANEGTIFKITPQGKLTTLYSFCFQSGCADGEYPNAGLVQDTNGDFYGTALLGGAYADGTLFSLSTGLGPFVKTLPVSGKEGPVVRILGNDLTGATGVTFNPVAAGFKVNSHSEISTTVPAGATTGRVNVVTPRGTLSSSLPFRVP